MKSAKDQVRDLLKSIPDHSTSEDIQYHLYVHQKISKGLQAARKGQTLSHEQVLKRATVRT